MSNAVPSSVAIPIGPRALLRIEALPVGHHSELTIRAAGRPVTLHF
jgi:hypothetical protein